MIWPVGKIHSVMQCSWEWQLAELCIIQAPEGGPGQWHRPRDKIDIQSFRSDLSI